MYYFPRIPPTLFFEFLRFVLRTPPFCFSFLPVFLGKTSLSHPLFLPMIFALLFPCLGSSVPHAPSIPSLVKLFSPGASLRLFLLQLRITSSPIYPACFSRSLYISSFFPNPLIPVLFLLLPLILPLLLLLLFLQSLPLLYNYSVHSPQYPSFP